MGDLVDNILSGSVILEVFLEEQQIVNEPTVIVIVLF